MTAAPAAATAAPQENGVSVGGLQPADGEPCDRDRSREHGRRDGGESRARLQLVVGEDRAPTLVRVLGGERERAEHADEHAAAVMDQPDGGAGAVCACGAARGGSVLSIATPAAMLSTATTTNGTASAQPAAAAAPAPRLASTTKAGEDAVDPGDHRRPASCSARPATEFIGYVGRAAGRADDRQSGAQAGQVHRGQRQAGTGDAEAG